MRIATPLVAVGLIVLSGCGEKRETTTGGAPAGGPASATLTVSETEFKLNPSSPQAKAGAVTVQVKNDGATDHALEIKTPTGEVKTAAIAPGKTATLKANLTPGTYAMYCPIDGHKAKGMQGSVVVGGSGGGTSTDKGGGSSGGGGRSYGGGGY
jgi:plastocyanin